jgi:hypothetical protein
MATDSPRLPFTQGDDHTLRGLRQAVGVEDNLYEISYPIASPGDFCECVTFPDDGCTLSSCDSEMYWGTFDVKFMDGTCYRLQFDERVVYASCPSGQTAGTEPYYVLCEIDFTDATTDTTGGITKAKTKKEETTPASVRQETTGGVAKTTHIHLTVHRLLTFALEAVLALQAPWV